MSAHYVSCLHIYTHGGQSSMYYVHTCHDIQFHYSSKCYCGNVGRVKHFCDKRIQSTGESVAQFVRCKSSKYHIFLKKMPRLLFFSALPQCGVYSRVALIRGAAFNVPLRVLTCNLVPSTFTRQFPADTMTDHEEFVFVCSFMCTSLLGSPS